MIVKNIFLHPVRMLLTLLSIVIGVTAVILTDSVSTAGTEVIADELDSLGIDCISVMSGDSGGFSLTNGDIALLEQISGVEKVYGILSESARLSTDSYTGRSVCWGLSDSENHLLSVELICGEFLSEEQIEKGEEVCVIGEETARQYLGCEPDEALGKALTATLKGTSRELRVIGVAAKGSGLIGKIVGEIVPEILYMPVLTLQELTDNDKLSQISVTLYDKSESSVNEALLAVRRRLSEAHGAISIDIENLTENKNSIVGAIATVRRLLTAIAGISVAVAAVGITNMMFISVTERRREIGIKKSVGATRLQIGSEFLAEGMTVSFIGCLLGILAACGICALIRALTDGFEVSVSPVTVLLSLSGSMLIGALFSVLPSFKAAGEKPIDCLKFM